jgi:glycosyltransferase involved in cell wall biosynthesis
LISPRITRIFTDFNVEIRVNGWKLFLSTSESGFRLKSAMTSTSGGNAGLKIAIDVTSYLASRTGVGVCVGALVKALLAAPQGDAYRLCAVSVRSGTGARLRRDFPEAPIRMRHAPLRLLVPMADQWAFPKVASLFGAADVFHAGPLFVPGVDATAMVVTVWDLTPLRFPEFHIASNLFTVDQLRRRLARARLVIVPSANTGKDLQELDLFPLERVRVIPLAVDEVFRPNESRAKGVPGAWGIAGEYLLSVGALEPRKNLPRLFQALRILKDRYRIPHKLVVVGPKGWKHEEIALCVTRLNLADSVVFTGYVSDADLNVFYNNAALLVYPSLYEGFGLPPLEAMAAGCPVAVSNTSSLPEVVGDAGVYFDPLQVEDMVQAIRQVLDSPGLRTQLITRGRIRSRQFSWQATAASTRRVYHEALGLPHYPGVR